MSHDFWMEDGSGEDIGDTWLNYTRNVSPMWYEAMQHAIGRPTGVQDTEGMTGAEAHPLFAAAVEYMVDNADHLRTMNPANKWGNYEGATQFLRNIAGKCNAYPDAIVRWSI